MLGFQNLHFELKMCLVVTFILIGFYEIHLMNLIL